MSYKHLYRSADNRRIAGIAGGIAEYFGVDPTPIRLLWLLAIFLGGSGILAYLIAWLVIPEAPFSESNQPQPVNGDHIMAESVNPSDSDRYRRHPGFMYIGIFLILLGGIFLLREFLPWRLFRYSWALLLIALGILLLFPRRKEPK